MTAVKKYTSVINKLLFWNICRIGIKSLYINIIF